MNLQSTLANIVDELKTKDRVVVSGFGVFKRATRKARVGRNPKTGEPVQIAEKQVLTFKASAASKAKG